MRRPGAAQVGVVFACALLVALLAFQVLSNGPMARIDGQVTLWLAAHRTPGLTRFMLLVSTLHENVSLLGISAVLAVSLRRQREWWRAAPLAVVPVGMLLNAGLKLVFRRPRPHLPEPLVHLATFSFPSGHAAASTVFYGALCALVFAHSSSRAVRTLALGLAALMVLLVTFSRVYLGAHYVSDVVAGVAVGAICLALLLPPLRARAAALVQ